MQNISAEYEVNPLMRTPAVTIPLEAAVFLFALFLVFGADYLRRSNLKIPAYSFKVFFAFIFLDTLVGLNSNLMRLLIEGDRIGLPLSVHLPLAMLSTVILGVGFLLLVNWLRT